LPTADSRCAAVVCKKVLDFLPPYDALALGHVFRVDGHDNEGAICKGYEEAPAVVQIGAVHYRPIVRLPAEVVVVVETPILPL
jgi:hypothetical protein